VCLSYMKTWVYVSGFYEEQLGEVLNLVFRQSCSKVRRQTPYMQLPVWESATQASLWAHIVRAWSCIGAMLDGETEEKCYEKDVESFKR
jgi:hypothetical protein